MSFGGLDVATSIALQTDGKAVVGGYTNFVSGSNDFALIRLNTDGNLDTTFDGDGRVTTNFGATDQVNSLVIQSDGKIIAAGSYDGGASDFAIARYNTNGSLDSTFSLDGAANFTFNNTFFGNAEFATSVKLQADGKIVVVGYTNTDTASGDNDFALVRLNTDGSLDTTFNISVDTLGGNTFFTEKSLTPVALDGTVAVTDAELTGSNYGGATLTLARQGGANAQDVFSATGGALSALTEGNALLLSGVIIGGVVQNSGGLLSLSFNANATQARVNQTLSSLAYLNTSNNPSAQVRLEWTFNDGNSGAQGTGGALSATGITTVNIALINDAPTAPANATTYTNPNSTYTFTLPDFGFNDAEDANLAGIRIDTLPTSGTLRVDGFNLPAANLEFTATDIQAGRLTFAPGAGGGNFQYKVKDSGGAFNVAQSVMTVSTSGEIWNGTAGNDIHVGTILADTLNGLGGNDTITGGAGNDAINGGLGYDRADYSSLPGAYTITRNGLTTTVSGPDGTDTLTGIERLQFSDLSVRTLEPAERDFGNDGRSDVLWRNDNGYVLSWTMNGAIISGSSLLAGVSADWKITDGSGDYNGDGKSDILWRNDNGAVLGWLMDGATIAANPLIATITTDWKIADGAGDYNGDGKSDLLWRNDNGNVVTWLMDGGAIASSAYIASVPADWKIADGSGDYNGDGKSDVLWRNDNGNVLIWLMDGTSISSSPFVASVPTDWKIADGAGDYNGDGKSDILWRNDNGNVLQWQMNGGVIASSPFIASVPTDWKIADGSSDYNGDGKTDVLWRNDNGNTLIWSMEGATISSAVSVASVSADWNIQS